MKKKFLILITTGSVMQAISSTPCVKQQANPNAYAIFSIEKLINGTLVNQLRLPSGNQKEENEIVIRYEQKSFSCFRGTKRIDCPPCKYRSALVGAACLIYSFVDESFSLASGASRSFRIFLHGQIQEL